MTPDNLFGLKVYIDRHLCDSPTFVRWKRHHRKRRIDKKWRKRYGALMEYCKGKVFRMGRDIVCCPHGAELLKKGIK